MSRSTVDPPPVSDASAAVPWLKLVLSVGAVFSLFHLTASLLGSVRGEQGFLVGALVVGALYLIRRLAWHEGWSAAFCALGLGAPTGRSLVLAVGVGALLLLVLPLFIVPTDSAYGFYPGWFGLLPGLFAQAGIAEEVLFRGHLFGTVRRRYPFWRAATLSAGPFLAAHLLMFASLPWPVALASCGLALVTSFPLAHFFELGGRTIWAPALLHFVIQSGLKVVEVSGAQAPLLPLAWIAAAALLPWLVFLVPSRRPDAAVTGRRG